MPQDIEPLMAVCAPMFFFFFFFCEDLTRIQCFLKIRREVVVILVEPALS